VLQNKRILLIVSGGIAAVKVPDLIRRLRDLGAYVRCILTEGGAQFVTPMSLAALSGDKVFQDLFSLTDESDMGHIRLSRDADLVLVAPATANIMAKMAYGLADDLATTALLATDKPVIIAPSMNVMMWNNAATRTNLATLKDRGIGIIGPDAGDLACGEVGDGRLADTADIITAVERFLQSQMDQGPLSGYTALVTSGPTHEPIDPVRYIANHSSGKQGHAIAEALSSLGAAVTLVSGPTHQPDPDSVFVVKVETAAQMLAACQSALPTDIAVCAAAVADWRVSERCTHKLKKGDNSAPSLSLTENPDILATLAAAGSDRPELLIGFAAETEEVLTQAIAKRGQKDCDWIIANDVSNGFGNDRNTVQLITEDSIDEWPTMEKREVAIQLAKRIAEHLKSVK